MKFRLLLAGLMLGNAGVCLLAASGNVEKTEWAVGTKVVSTVAGLQKAAEGLQPGDTLWLEDGTYSDVRLTVRASGSAGRPVVVRPVNAGKVRFTGDVKVELRGNHIEFSGIYFTDGARNPSEWKSHGPGLVAVYGDHCTIHDCLFYRFDEVNSAYITTSLDEHGRVPRYCRIHHCAFIEKTTLDQVINLNNTPAKTLKGEPGVPMYHRIDHCYFSNPPKKGNAGGGIRIGYWRKDYGRCLVDHNLFERQDSEAEIITSKSMENVIYANTFLNCRGTMNLRHGDRQVALNNFFIGSDTLHEYGGMFVWGSGHIIGGNYFSLPRTLHERGGAAVSFNAGPEASEHALAYNIIVANNLFANNGGAAFDFSSFYERRAKVFGENEVKLPYGIRFVENKFFAGNGEQSLWKEDMEVIRRQEWSGNVYGGFGHALVGDLPGMKEAGETKLRRDGLLWKADGVSLKMDRKELERLLPYRHIEGIDLDFVSAIAEGPSGKPLQRSEVGPSWCKEFPGTYAGSGLWKAKVNVKKKPGGPKK